MSGFEGVPKLHLLIPSNACAFCSLMNARKEALLRDAKRTYIWTPLEYEVYILREPKYTPKSAQHTLALQSETSTPLNIKY